MSNKPIGIVIEGGTIVGVVNCETQIHVIDLDTKEIWRVDAFTEWSEDEYRDYVKNTLQDLTGESPYQSTSDKGEDLLALVTRVLYTEEEEEDEEP